MADRKYKKTDNYKALASEDPVSGSVFLDQVLERFDIDLRNPVTQIIVRWKDFAGSAIAEHSVCEKYSDGVLYVICDHPSRTSYIRMNSSEIIKRIRGVYPEVDLKKIVTRTRAKRTT